ncbi:hypothetical protein Pfo_007315 [Paulownia fortunei]|nr:hypothetical protein Pfo_007315 [Paulownia fortunei]
MFVQCCCSISIYSFIAGFAVLEKASLAGSPALIHIYRSFLATSLLYSWYYGLGVRCHMQKIPELATSQTLAMQVLVAYLKFLLTSEVVICILYLHVCMIWVLCIMKVGVESTLYVFLVLATLYVRGTYWARYRACLDEWLTNSPSIAARLWRKRKIVEFGMGMMGSILFQNFVKLTSMEHVVAFICFAMVWLCSIVVIHPPTDFGILTFLLESAASNTLSVQIPIANLKYLFHSEVSLFTLVDEFIFCSCSLVEKEKNHRIYGGNAVRVLSQNLVEQISTDHVAAFLCFAVVDFEVLDEASIAVSPALVHLFRSFLATSQCYSWYYGFGVRLFVLKVPEFATSETLSVQVLVANLKCLVTSEVAIFILAFHVGSTYRARYHASLEEWLTDSPSIAACLWRKRKIVEFGLGMLGSILFQNFVKLTSMKHSVSELHEIDIHGACGGLLMLCLGLGFMALDEEKSKISPLVMFLLNRLLAICVCHSSTYALVHRPGANASLVNHLKVSIFGFSFLLYVYIVSGPVPLRLILCYAVLVIASLMFFMSAVDFGLSVDFLVRAIIFSLRVHRDRFFPAFVLVAAFFTAGIAAMLDGLSSDQTGSPGADPETKLVEKYSKKRKFVELAAAILASLLFQILVRFTSFSHVLAFLCFAVAWLGCLALVMPRHDLGIFDLLVCNVLVGCVNQFSLYAPTWFAYGASVVLFILHSKVKTVRLVHDHDTVLW